MRSREPLAFQLGMPRAVLRRPASLSMGAAPSFSMARLLVSATPVVGGRKPPDYASHEDHHAGDNRNRERQHGDHPFCGVAGHLDLRLVILAFRTRNAFLRGVRPR